MAAAYLKENETVYITGQLNGDTEPVKINENQANVQVRLANNFIMVDVFWNCTIMSLSNCFMLTSVLQKVAHFS